MKKYKNVTCEVVYITPTMAADWLEANTNNFRKLCKNRVALYAVEITRDRWDLNGESIVFLADGSLSNGQHRLSAVVKAGKGIWSVVVRGIEANSRTVDRGKPRSIAQWLHHEGIPNATEMAGAGKQILLHERGKWNITSVQMSVCTDSEIIEWVIEHQERLHAAMRLAKKAKGFIAASVMTAIIYLGSCEDIEEDETAAWFMDRLQKGDDLSETDAVFHLREALQNDRPSRPLCEFAKKGLATIAWNRTVQGLETKKRHFRLRLTGPRKQPFPNQILQTEDAE